MYVCLSVCLSMLYPVSFSNYFVFVFRHCSFQFIRLCLATVFATKSQLLKRSIHKTNDRQASEEEAIRLGHISQTIETSQK